MYFFDKLHFEWYLQLHRDVINISGKLKLRKFFRFENYHFYITAGSMNISLTDATFSDSSFVFSYVTTILQLSKLTWHCHKPIKYPYIGYYILANCSTKVVYYHVGKVDRSDICRQFKTLSMSKLSLQNCQN